MSVLLPRGNDANRTNALRSDDEFFHREVFLRVESLITAGKQGSDP
jgi:hypothetical protein